MRQSGKKYPPRFIKEILRKNESILNKKLMKKIKK